MESNTNETIFYASLPLTSITTTLKYKIPTHFHIKSITPNVHTKIAQIMFIANLKLISSIPKNNWSRLAHNRLQSFSISLFLAKNSLTCRFGLHS